MAIKRVLITMAACMSLSFAGADEAREKGLRSAIKSRNTTGRYQAVPLFGCEPFEMAPSYQSTPSSLPTTLSAERWDVGAGSHTTHGLRIIGEMSLPGYGQFIWVRELLPRRDWSGGVEVGILAAHFAESYVILVYTGPGGLYIDVVDPRYANYSRLRPEAWRQPAIGYNEGVDFATVSARLDQARQIDKYIISVSDAKATREVVVDARPGGIVTVR